MASLCLATLASPGPAARAHARSPFLGKWALDLAQRPASYGPAPKSVTYEFADLGQELWETRIHIVDAKGGVHDLSIRYRRDGQASAGTGYPSEGDTAAVSTSLPNVLVMTLARDKQLASARTYAVSANGREMIESAADVDNQGMPYVRNFKFKRIQ